MKAGMITPSDIPLLERKLAEASNYQSLNVHFSQKRGGRWADKLQAFAAWLWQNREAILRILGLIILFAEDGTPTLKEVGELDEATLQEAKQNLASRKPTKLTPHGEKVEDFTPEGGRGYDIGLEDNPLVKESDKKPEPKAKRKKAEKNVEVQLGTDSGEDVVGYQPDDV